MSFYIHIHEAVHGWLAIELTVGSRRLELMASDVYNDPLRELAELALFLANGQTGVRGVELHFEPDYYELRANKDDELRLQLVYVEDRHVAPEEAITGTASAREILHCLRSAQPLLTASPPEDGRVWDEPFPELAVARLEGLRSE